VFEILVFAKFRFAKFRFVSLLPKKGISLVVGFFFSGQPVGLSWHGRGWAGGRGGMERVEVSEFLLDKTFAISDPCSKNLIF